MAEHEPSIGATSEWFTPPEYFEGPELRPLTPRTSASHGENSASSPLGSANSFKDSADFDPSASNTCPINVCGQRWTIRFASGPRLEGGRLGTNAPIVKDAARFETGTRKCGLMKNPHSRRPPGARSR